MRRAFLPAMEVLDSDVRLEEMRAGFRGGRPGGGGPLPANVVCRLRPGLETAGP